MTVLAMSHGELSRYDTLLRVERGKLRIEVETTLLVLKTPHHPPHVGSGCQPGVKTGSRNRPCESSASTNFTSTAIPAVYASHAKPSGLLMKSGPSSSSTRIVSWGMVNMPR